MISRGSFSDNQAAAREKIAEIVRDSIRTKTSILEDKRFLEKIHEAAVMISGSLSQMGKVLIFGNGGSAADSQHFAAELMGRFQRERPAQAAVALTTDSSFLTAVANDYSFDRVFERQIEGLARGGDIVFAISTSGEAKNVIAAVRRARDLKVKTVALTGKGGGELGRIADLALIVPSGLTARIQEAHILIIHIISELVEDELDRDA